MTWYLYAIGPAALVDGPWGYSDENVAREAFGRYAARVEADRPDLKARMVKAEDLDSLVASHPDEFAGATARLRLRTARQLATVDRRVRMFTPMGLAPSAPMTDEDALVLAQQRLRSLTLSPSVPEVVSRHFEALCELQLYGCFAYDFSGMVNTLSTLAHELALGAKFMETYSGRVPLVNERSGETTVLEETNFGRIVERLAHDGSHPWQKHWRLEGHRRFRPSLSGLLYWARDRGLFAAWLAQQWERARYGVISVDISRNRPEKWTPEEYDSFTDEQRYNWWETEGRRRWEKDRLDHLADFRNYVAHPTSHNVLTPLDGTRALGDLAKFINVLWSNESRGA